MAREQFVIKSYKTLFKKTVNWKWITHLKTLKSGFQFQYEIETEFLYPKRKLVASINMRI